MYKRSASKFNCPCSDRKPQSLTVAGQYDLWVRKGSISLFGSIIHSSSTLHRVTSPLTHSVPCIRHVRNPYGPTSQAAEVAFLSCSSRIRLLQRISNNFEGIWDAYPQRSGQLSSMPLRSFNFVRPAHKDYADTDHTEASNLP